MENLANSQMTEFYPKKEHCYTNYPDADVYVARDVSPNNPAKEFAGMTWAELESYTEDGNHHLYEIIKEDRPRYSYFDIDATYQRVKHSINEGEDFGKMITEKLQLTIEDFKADNDIQEQCDLVVLNASTKNKFSYHFVDRSISFADVEACKIYHERFLDHLYQVNETLLTSIIDKGVYDRDRNFRLINQTKFKDGAVPLTLTSDHTLVDTFITLTDNSTQYEIPKRWYKKKRKEVIAPITENVDDDEMEELLMIVDHLRDDRFVEYDLWLKTVWAMHACGFQVDDIHYVSQNRCPEKYDYYSTENVIKQYDHSKSKFNIETLKAWSKADSGFELERVRDRIKQEQPQHREDHFQFLDLLRKYQGRMFPLQSGIDQFEKDISSCVSMVVGAEVLFTMYTNDDSQYDMTKTLPKLSFRYSYLDDGKEATTEYTLQKYMVAFPLKFPLYNKIVFKPNGVGVKSNELNTWCGFKAQEVSVVNMDVVKVFTDHIHNVWADGNREYSKYLMSWIAQVIKHPERKTDVAILLQGGQGSGKTLPCDILLERVFGRNIGMSSSGLGSLTQRFNGCTMSKVFCKVDELSVVDGDSFNASFDKMKSLITDRHIQIEKKGMEHIMIDNHINFIMTTNHRHTVKIEADDRRYACFEVSDKYKQDTGYFADFMDLLDTDEAGNHIYTYFKNYPDAEMVNLRKIPMTSIKQEMLENSRSSVERFIERMDESYDEALLYDWVGKDGQKAISCVNFYEKYREWCGMNGEKPWSSKAVGCELKNKKLYKESGRNQYNKDQRRYYTF